MGRLTEAKKEIDFEIEMYRKRNDRKLYQGVINGHRQTAHSAGYDITCPESVTIGAGETVMIKSEAVLDCPSNCYGLMTTRSSLSIKHGIILLPTTAIIDADYKDPVMLCLKNISDEPYYIDAGDRVAQIVICKYERFEDVITERNGGIGSTTPAPIVEQKAEDLVAARITHHRKILTTLRGRELEYRIDVYLNDKFCSCFTLIEDISNCGEGGKSIATLYGCGRLQRIADAIDVDKLYKEVGVDVICLDEWIDTDAKVDVRWNENGIQVVEEL